MQDKIHAAIMGSLCADAFALGVHWVYAPEKIVKRYGKVETLLTPELAPFHKGKTAGELTHYGDQMLLLLQSVHTNGNFNPEAFSNEWKQRLSNYEGYMDHATKETLAAYEKGTPYQSAGSTSSDISAASRIAPLLLAHADDPKSLVDAATTQTAMTHNHLSVIACAELFARTVYHVLQGQTPKDAVKMALDSSDTGGMIEPLVTKGLQKTGGSTFDLIQGFGTACSFEGALPSTVHLITHYENDYKEALIQNVMAGGDSAARGLAVGMILGAHLGMGAIPREWTDGMKAKADILKLLK